MLDQMRSAKRLLTYKTKVAKAKMRYWKKVMEFRKRHLTKYPKRNRI